MDIEYLGFQFAVSCLQGKHVGGAAWSFQRLGARDPERTEMLNVSLRGRRQELLWELLYLSPVAALCRGERGQSKDLNNAEELEQIIVFKCLQKEKET